MEPGPGKSGPLMSKQRRGRPKPDMDSPGALHFPRSASAGASSVRNAHDECGADRWVVRGANATRRDRVKPKALKLGPTARHQTGALTMSDLLSELSRQARSLSPEERAQLAEVMLESLQEPASSGADAAWNREIRDRVAAYERGESRTTPAVEVFAEARRLTR